MHLTDLNNIFDDVLVNIKFTPEETQKILTWIKNYRGNNSTLERENDQVERLKEEIRREHEMMEKLWIEKENKCRYFDWFIEGRKNVSMSYEEYVREEPFITLHKIYRQDRQIWLIFLTKVREEIENFKESK